MEKTTKYRVFNGFFTEKSLYFVVCLAEKERFELSRGGGNVWKNIVFGGILPYK